MGFRHRFAPHMTKMEAEQIISLQPKPGEDGFIDFAADYPAVDLLPKKDIVGITNTLLKKSFSEIVQSGSAEGYRPARAAMAKMIARHGLSPKEDEIIVTSGSLRAIDLICKLFIEPGDVALVEAPTYSGALQVFRSHRAQAIHLISDGDGPIPEDLERKLNIFAPKIVYLNPTFKNPSGAVISPERRRIAAEMTGRSDVLLIEDDPFGDFRYKGEQLPPIKSFDGAGNVVYIASASHILGPGMRVGAAYMPAELVRAAAAAMRVSDMHASVLPQAVFAEYAERGFIDLHISGYRAVYKDKLNIAMKMIRDFFPGDVKVSEPSGGIFIWCECPAGVDSDEVLERAVKEKVAFASGRQFYCNGDGRNAFRINFACAANPDITKGLEILGGLLRGAT